MYGDFKWKSGKKSRLRFELGETRNVEHNWLRKKFNETKRSIN